MILPLVGVTTGLMELLIQLVVLAGLMAWYQFIPGWQIVFAPLFVALATFTALSAGLWLTALNVKYRDVGQAIPFLSQAWMWISPIVYTSQAVPEEYRLIYGLNPMVGVIEGFRWCFLGTTNPDWMMMSVSIFTVSTMLVTGLLFFRKTENGFADII